MFVPLKSPTSPRPSPLLACNLGHPFVTRGLFRNSKVHTRASALGLLQESCVCGGGGGISEAVFGRLSFRKWNQKSSL